MYSPCVSPSPGNLAFAQTTPLPGTAHLRNKSVKIYSTRSNMRLPSFTKLSKFSPVKINFLSLNFYSTLCLYFDIYQSVP